MPAPRRPRVAARRLGPSDAPAVPGTLSTIFGRCAIPLALLVGSFVVIGTEWGLVVGLGLAAGSMVPTRIYRRLALATRVTWWTGLAICSASIVLTWWLSSFGDHHGPYYVIGPFHVPVTLEWALGLGVFAAACGGRLLSARRASAGSRCSSLTVALLAVASILGTVGWRAVTSRGEGANIGAGFLLLVGPLFIAGLLHLALTAERVARSGRLRHYLATSIGIWAVALWISVGTW